MADFRPKNQFFGDLTGLLLVSRLDIVIDRFSGQKYVSKDVFNHSGETSR
jgi:hypothetical protein